MQKIMHKPPPLSTLRTDIPMDVERVIMKALEIEAQIDRSRLLNGSRNSKKRQKTLTNRNGLAYPGWSFLAPVGPRSMSMTSEREVSDDRDEWY
jgi:hypothetical protein